MNRLGLEKGIKNFVFLGEAGCGKSEVAINLALYLAKNKKEKEVHFFDLDMTKPLFRSRDLAEMMEKQGVTVHYQEQFMDAPTTIGGVVPKLGDDVYTILDVGGDYIGARSIGAYASQLMREYSQIFYVINPFRPWSSTLERIDRVLGQILFSSRLTLNKLEFIGNPNIGPTTQWSDVEAGLKKLEKELEGLKEVVAVCVNRDLAGERKEMNGIPIFPIDLFLTYDWQDR